VVNGSGGGWVVGRFVRDQEPPLDLGTVTRTTVRGKIEKSKNKRGRPNTLSSELNRLSTEVEEKQRVPRASRAPHLLLLSVWSAIARR